MSDLKRPQPPSSGGGKIPGKTVYAGRRRAMTRTSGFSVHKDTTGGQFRRHNEDVHTLSEAEELCVTFHIIGHNNGDLIGFGLWFWHTDGVEISLVDAPKKHTITSFGSDAWNKAGSIWKAKSSEPITVTFRMISKNDDEKVAVYLPICGKVSHKHYETAPERLLKNMYETAPESIFIGGTTDSNVDIVLPEDSISSERELVLKSCNRCGRYLPINIDIDDTKDNERKHLSFTNHCVAAHRRPCKHATFGRLRNIDNDQDIIQLDYGYQLECRFCKKFEVNAAHNPQRSASQMKEDGARRRAFEYLLTRLYQASPQMAYRQKFGSELADDIWKKFDKKCFNCSCELKTARKMNLDHTRPLAFLWTLDETATALCKTCNSLKRDRMPADFYTAKGQLERLAEITGIPIKELLNPTPNEAAIDYLMERKEWLFTKFLTSPQMVKERDGKITGELVVKALQRVLASSAKHRSTDLIAEYNKRREKLSK